MAPFGCTAHCVRPRECRCGRSWSTRASAWRTSWVACSRTMTMNGMRPRMPWHSLCSPATGRCGSAAAALLQKVCQSLLCSDSSCCMPWSALHRKEQAKGMVLSQRKLGRQQIHARRPLAGSVAAPILLWPGPDEDGPEAGKQPAHRCPGRCHKVRTLPHSFFCSCCSGIPLCHVVPEVENTVLTRDH